jgi:hypothetical protein
MALANWPITLWTVLSFTAGFLWNLKYGPEHRVKWKASENCKTKVEGQLRDPILQKQQSVVTHRYTVSQQTETIRRFLIEQHLSTSCFYEIQAEATSLWIQNFDRK